MHFGHVPAVADFSSNTMLGGLAPTTLVGSRVPPPPAANNLSQAVIAAVVEVVLPTWNEE